MAAMQVKAARRVVADSKLNSAPYAPPGGQRALTDSDELPDGSRLCGRKPVQLGRYRRFSRFEVARRSFSCSTEHRRTTAGVVLSIS